MRDFLYFFDDDKKVLKNVKELTLSFDLLYVLYKDDTIE